MKKLLFAIVCAMSVATLFAAGEVQVKVTETAPKNTYAVKTAATRQAKILAVEKYVTNSGYKLDERVKDELKSNYALFITDFEEISCEWEEIGPSEGMLSLEATITLDEAKILNWLKEKGVSMAMDRVSIFVLEEPPSLGALKLSNAFGTGVDGTKFFIQNYTLFQRRIRDEITRNIGEYFDVVLLEDDELYSNHKKSDMNLLGVYFDPETEKFVVNEGLLAEVKANQPETIVMYYRLDSLAFDYSTKKILVSVALSFKNLETKATKSIGTREWSEQLDTVAQDMIMGRMAACVSTAANNLLKTKGSDLLSMVKAMVNKVDQAQHPAKLTINAGIFDAKTRKRNLFALKKAIKAAGLATDESIKTTSTTLIATLDSKFTDLDEVYFEQIEGILTEIGVEISDEQVHIDSVKRTITIIPETGDEE